MPGLGGPLEPLAMLALHPGMGDTVAPGCDRGPGRAGLPCRGRRLATLHRG